MPIPGRPPSLINPPVGLPLPSALPVRAARPRAHRPAARAGPRRAEPPRRLPARSRRCASACGRSCGRATPEQALRRPACRGAPSSRRGARQPPAASGTPMTGRGRRSPRVASRRALSRDLVKHFPITRGIVFQRKVGAVRAVDGVELRGAPRRDARDRRRDGLRQEHDRAADHAAARRRPRARSSSTGEDITARQGRGA